MNRPDKLLAAAGATVLGVLYVVVLGGHLVSVRVGFAAPLAAGAALARHLA